MSKTETPATDRVGGKSAVDDALRPVVQNFIAGILDMFSNHRGIDNVLRELSPTVRAMTKFLPMGTSYLMARLPAAYFKSPEQAHFVQDIVVEASRHIDKIIQDKGSPDKVTPKEYEEALKKGYEAAAAKKYVVDPNRLLHMPGCVDLATFRKSFHQPKGNPQHQQPPQGNLHEVTLKEALDQQLSACPHCFKQIAADWSKQATPPKTEKKPRSPMEVIGASGDPELRKRFFAWIKGLSEDERKRVLKLLEHVDSVVEFEVLMDIEPDLRADMLTLCENTNASFAIAKYLDLLGSALKAGAGETVTVLKGAWQGYKRFDESLAPLVVKLEADLKKPRDQKSWKDWFSMFLPFNT